MRFQAAILLAILNLFVVASVASAGEFSVKPRLTIAEEYNDNVFGSRVYKKSDFITRVMPACLLAYNGPSLDCKVDYAFVYSLYGQGVTADRYSHALRASAHAKLIDNFMYLDASDVYSRVSIDSNRDSTAVSSYLNQTDSNVLSVSPYIEFTPAQRLTIKTGYLYRNYRYTNRAAISRTEHGAFFRATEQFTHKFNMFLNVAYGYTIPQYHTSYSRITPSVGLEYEYALDAFIELEGGYSYVFGSNIKSFGSPYWRVKMSYPIHSVVASVRAGVAYDADVRLTATEKTSVMLRLDKTISRGKMDVYAQYSELSNSYTTSSYAKSIEVGANAIYDLSARTTGHLDIAVNKYTGSAAYKGNGYRMLVGAGLSYILPYDMTVGLNYIYTSYSSALFGSGNNNGTNRVTLFVTKQFKGMSFSTK